MEELQMELKELQALQFALLKFKFVYVEDLTDDEWTNVVHAGNVINRYIQRVQSLQNTEN